jgi:hypothetical protein
VMVTDGDGSGACSLLMSAVAGDTEVTVGAAVAAPAAWSEVGTAKTRSVATRAPAAALTSSRRTIRPARKSASGLAPPTLT